MLSFGQRLRTLFKAAVTWVTRRRPHGQLPRHKTAPEASVSNTSVNTELPDDRFGWAVPIGSGSEPIATLHEATERLSNAQMRNQPIAPVTQIGEQQIAANPGPPAGLGPSAYFDGRHNQVNTSSYGPLPPQALNKPVGPVNPPAAPQVPPAAAPDPVRPVPPQRARAGRRARQTPRPKLPYRAKPKAAPAADPDLPNRAARRAYERARRKYDRFVEPKGPQPLPLGPRGAPRDQPRPVLVPVNAEGAGFADPNAKILIDKPVVTPEHIGGDEDVLYEHAELWGEFNFRDTILNQLERYFIYLQRMKAHDPGAYNFYKQVGATIVPYASLHLSSDTQFEKSVAQWKVTKEQAEAIKQRVVLPTWFKQYRPAFGCVAYGTNPVDEYRELNAKAGNSDKFRLWIPKFFYFVKYDKPPAAVQPTTGGSVYGMTVWWDRPQDEKYKRYKGGRPEEFCIWVNDAGDKLRVLKTRKHGHKMGQWWDWRYPNNYTQWARRHGLDVQTHLGSLFTDAVKTFEYSNYSMVRVAVHKDDLTAVFGVNVRKMAYFFQDRDIQLNAHGQRKRIFHIVRPHVRSDGVEIKMHFRGEREFDWADYHVSITVPGLDHIVIPEFNVGVVNLEKNERRSKDNLTFGQVGKQISDHIKGKSLREAFKDKEP